MKITKLKLTGFKRIALTGYTNIEIDFTNKVQLILGTNSSGKSSIMHELSPLPIVTSDLTTDGSKEIWIEHHNETYYLSNHKSGKCSLIRLSDNEELNPGGTQTVQKEMIKQIFNYDTKVHDLLLGLENFTDMKPTRRKEWITELSDVNYDFALRVFSGLKERLRDTQGALKLAKKKLVEATEIRTDEAAVEELRRRIQLGEAKLEQLNSLRIPEVGYANTANLEDLQSIYSKAIDYARRSAKIKSYLLGKDVNGLKYRIEYLNSEINKVNQSRDSLAKELLEKHAQLDEMKSLGNTDKQSLLTDRQRHLGMINDLIGSLYYQLAYDHVPTCLQSLRECIPDLSRILNSLPSNTEGNYTRESVKTLNTQIANTEYKLNELNQALSRVEVEINHLEKHRNEGSITCPKCTHDFTPGFNQLTFDTLMNKRVSYIATREAETAQLSVYKEQLQEQNQYYLLFDELSTIVRSATVLKPIWNLLLEDKLVSTYPKQALVVINKCLDDLDKLMQVGQIKEELRSIDTVLEKIEWQSGQSTNSLQSTIDNDEIKLGEYIAEISQLQTQCRQAVQDLKLHTQSEALLDASKSSLKLIEDTISSNIDRRYNESLIASIRVVQSTIGELANELNSITNNRAIIRNMEENVAKLESDEGLLKIMMTELSPTEGLIASGLMGFITHLINQMNVLINSVWSYAMNIIPPSYADDGSAELDYKFPFKMVSDANRVADISLGSKGQREIINLAFRIVAATYLHLEDVPIYADEFGTGLDETHRKRAAEAIKNIVAESNYSQLFMISHYEDAHGSLTNAEVCVLSADNITVPAEYNTHVTFS